MKKYQSVREAWLERGVGEEPLDFAIDSIRQGVSREHITEGLTADYRGLNFLESTALLDELYAAHGGEFRNARRSGLGLGIPMLVIGAGLTYFIYKNFSEGGFVSIPRGVLMLPAGCALYGALLVFKALAAPGEIEQ
jgi:hypothetical protein